MVLDSYQMGESIIQDDVTNITAKYLINNIEMSFMVWQEMPWGKDIPFDVFCEEILPYRVGTEPLENWREKVLASFADLYRSSLNIINIKKMKVIILLSVMFFFENTVMCQPVIHFNGGEYDKTIAYNVLFKRIPEELSEFNLKHKSILDRIFFGITNSFVEYVFEDSPEGTNEATALRIIKSSQDGSCKLEVMRFQDMFKVYDIRNLISEQRTPIILPFWLSTGISQEISDQINEHNKQANHFKYSDELYKSYRPKPETLELSKEFAEKLHKKTMILIDNFKGEREQAIISDGSIVTFRCVVADELWALTIHCPQGRALQLSDLFRQIIADSLDNKFEESKYLPQLE